MQQDHRIILRLRPRQIRALRALAEASVAHPNIVAHIGLGREEVEMALDALMQIPIVGPLTTHNS